MLLVMPNIIAGNAKRLMWWLVTLEITLWRRLFVELFLQLGMRLPMMIHTRATVWKIGSSYFKIQKYKVETQYSNISGKFLTKIYRSHIIKVTKFLSVKVCIIISNY